MEAEGEQVKQLLEVKAEEEEEATAQENLGNNSTQVPVAGTRSPCVGLR